MTKRTRRTHSPGFEAKVALAALKGEKTGEGFFVRRLARYRTQLRSVPRTSQARRSLI